MPDTTLTPDSFMQAQGPTVTPDSYMASTAPTQPQDALQKALNYRTGYGVADLPLGLLQGAAKGLASTGYGLVDLANKVVPNPIQVDPAYRASITDPNGIGQGTGEFLEQAAEFALPSAGMSKLAEGAPLIARMAGQAAVGSGVSAAQSGGDPVSAAIGGLLGAGTELGGAAMKAINAPKAATVQGFKDAFAAVPTQTVAINRAMDTLKADGVVPAKSLPEMAQVITNRLSDLGRQYDAVLPQVQGRSIPAAKVIGPLKVLQKAYLGGTETASQQVASGMLDQFGNPIMKTVTTSKPIVSSEYKPFFDQIQSDITTAQKLANQNGGKLTFNNIRYLRDGANEATDFSKLADLQGVFRDIGDTYRKALNEVAPETTDLNNKYAKYKELNNLAQHNLEMGRGTTKSGLTNALESAADRGIGGAIGAGIGSAFHFPGEYIGSLAGAALYPKLAKPAVEALQNAANSGALKNLGGAQMNSLVNALKRSDTQAILGLLGKGSTFRTLTQTAPPTT